MTTTEFREAWTMDAVGTTLKQTAAGACVFLGSEGCTVHPDRPLVCRLYPLGRHVLTNGREYFSHIEPHPLSEGTFTNKGTIAQYLDRQRAAPFLQAADEYFSRFCAAQDLFDQVTEDYSSANQTAEVRDAIEVLDMDLALTRLCSAAHRQEPMDLEARKQLHLEIIDELIIQQVSHVEK